MAHRINRRRFVHTSAAATGALALSACKQKSADTHSPQTRPSRQTKSTAPAALSESLPRETLLLSLDATADMRMRTCHHCAQASFISLQETFGLEGGAIVKALTPMPGIAERGETCGAVIGSLMALGLVFGRDRVEDWAAWRASLVPARAFCSRVEKEFGTLMCGDLLEKHFGRRFNLADPAELRAFQSTNPGPQEVCGGIVRKAVRIAAEIILDQHEPDTAIPPARQVL